MRRAGLLTSLGLSLLPALAFPLILFPLVAALGASALPLPWPFLLAWLAPFSLLGACAIHFAQHDLTSVTSRLRLNPLKPREWFPLLLVGGLLVALSLLPMGNLVRSLSFPIIPQPRALTQVTLDFTGWLRPAPGPFLALTAVILANVVAEELWWRGYLLPRQELAFGRAAWVWNGILWTGFHAFLSPTLGVLLAHLPLCLAVPYLAQRSRSTYPGMAIHALVNAFAWAPYLFAT